MVVEIGIEVGGVELLDALDVGGGDVAVTYMFADYGAVLGLDEVVAADTNVSKTRSTVGGRPKPLSLPVTNPTPN
jgi:hypothetical protein